LLATSNSATPCRLRSTTCAILLRPRSRQAVDEFVGKVRAENPDASRDESNREREKNEKNQRSRNSGTLSGLEVRSKLGESRRRSGGFSPASRVLCGDVATGCGPVSAPALGHASSANPDRAVRKEIKARSSEIGRVFRAITGVPSAGWMRISTPTMSRPRGRPARSGQVPVEA